jgi:hypothetical protein
LEVADGDGEMRELNDEEERVLDQDNEVRKLDVEPGFELVDECVLLLDMLDLVEVVETGDELGFLEAEVVEEAPRLVIGLVLELVDEGEVPTLVVELDFRLETVEEPLWLDNLELGADEEVLRLTIELGLELETVEILWLLIDPGLELVTEDKGL